MAGMVVRGAQRETGEVREQGESFRWWKRLLELEVRGELLK